MISLVKGCQGYQVFLGYRDMYHTCSIGSKGIDILDMPCIRSNIIKFEYFISFQKGLISWTLNKTGEFLNEM